MTLRELVLAAIAGDEGRGGSAATGDAGMMFAEVIQRLETDPLWAREYEDFVRGVSFGGPGEAIAFSAAIAAFGRLATVVSIH